MKLVINKIKTPPIDKRYFDVHGWQEQCCASYMPWHKDPVDYLLLSEIENPMAFWGEDARDYMLEGLVNGYIPHCKIAKMELSFPRALPIELKGVAV